MGLRTALTSIVLAGAVTLGIGSKANASLYDDFSTGSLNTSKWAERQYPEGQSFPDNHGVSSGNYLVSQTNPADKRIELISTRKANTGEVVSFDFNYVSGSGNNIATLVLDNITLDLRMGGDGYQVPPQFYSAGSGAIGFWNGEKEWGNQLGQYHMDIQFNSGTADISLLRPDNSTINYTTTGITPQTEWGFAVINGDNGYSTWTLDNVNVVPEPSTLGLLALGGLGLSAIRRRKNG